MAADQTFTAQELREAADSSDRFGSLYLTSRGAMLRYAAALRERLDGLEAECHGIEDLRDVTIRRAASINENEDFGRVRKVAHEQDAAMLSRLLALLDPAPVLAAGKEE